ncbi:hypothetical protein ACHHYP_02231 [Achlya hypogyna]|uniref:EF-hand domain-containing protein n=1 Tax=Achlya hypogyna TaxID=1202772 RepID=A0A1V9ZSD7_ACHHY|nr:hypothetical protein ACHHYP_02231 [Achlya hypogyna]
MSRRSVSSDGRGTTDSTRQYAEVLTLVREQQVVEKKACEAYKEQSALTTLMNEVDWLKKRKTRAFKRVKKQCAHLKHLRLWFDSYDVDKSGGISVQELVWPMLVLGFANTLEEIQDLLNAADSDGDGQIGFDDFVEIMNAHDTQGKDGVHPLEKLVQLVESGQLGDPTLSLQTLLPSYQRQLMLSALMTYGDASSTGPTRRDSLQREAHEAILKRANIALQSSKELHAIPLALIKSPLRKRGSVPPLVGAKTLNPMAVRQQLVKASERLRHSERADATTMHVFLGTVCLDQLRETLVV